MRGKWVVVYNVTRVLMAVVVRVSVSHLYYVYMHARGETAKYGPLGGSGDAFSHCQAV